MKTEKCFFHVDLDAFFASVEVLDNPSLRGKPVIVGGLPGDRRSVVSTCSYEARKFGVHSAMPIAKAYQLCPQGVYIRGRHQRYHELSSQVMQIFSDFSPDMQQMSVDEAFIDVSGTQLLWGDPEDTARRLKKRVKDETGLTVSVGIASNKYLAKIASGLSKPDGLYRVPEGKEEEFMLSLPLSKVWGIGSKSLARLNQLGFFTTQQVHEATLSGLSNIFGQSMGSFLYHVVRGQVEGSFDDEPKSRSISAERTFSFDLTEPYAIETALSQLAYTVFFRSLREKCRSKSVHLKIRYEDFTTVSIQETFQRTVSSSEDLYEYAKILFNRKWERGKGIRLLGLAMQNLMDGETEEQGELFDFGEQKKRTVEKTILNLEQKNHSIKLKKARHLIKCIVLGSLLVFSGKPDSASALTYENGDFSAEVSGTWEAKLESGLEFSKDQFSVKNPVFSQNIDLYTYAGFGDQFSFEGSFSKNFLSNSLLFEYSGTEDSALKTIKAGNRGIGLESAGIYGSEAPGVLFSFGDDSGTWSNNTLLRYEQLESNEKSFRGQKEIQFRQVNCWEYARGQFFSFPPEIPVSRIKNLFIETKDGNLERLSLSSYAVLSSQNMILLKNGAKGKLFADFLFDADFSEPDLTKAVSDLLQDCANLFCNGSIDKLLQLTGSDFSHKKGRMFLYAPELFSPFQNCSFYQAGGKNAFDEVYLSHEKSLDNSPSEAWFFNEFGEDFFDSEKYWIKAVPSGSGDYLSELFPFFAIDQGFYLSPEKTDFVCPFNIQYQETKSVSRYEIPTDAIPDSVVVTLNQIPAAFSYNPSSGVINIEESVKENDLVTIRWNEKAAQTEVGKIRLINETHWVLSENLELYGNFSSLWPFLPGLSEEVIHSGTDRILSGETGIEAGLKTGFSFSEDWALSLDSCFSAQFLNPDSSGFYLISNSEEKAKFNVEKLYGGTTAVLTEDFPSFPLNKYRKAGFYLSAPDIAGRESQISIKITFLEPVVISSSKMDYRKVFEYQLSEKDLKEAAISLHRISFDIPASAESATRIQIKIEGADEVFPEDFIFEDFFLADSVSNVELSNRTSLILENGENNLGLNFKGKYNPLDAYNHFFLNARGNWNFSIFSTSFSADADDLSYSISQNPSWIYSPFIQFKDSLSFDTSEKKISKTEFIGFDVPLDKVFSEIKGEAKADFLFGEELEKFSVDSQISFDAEKIADYEFNWILSSFRKKPQDPVSLKNQFIQSFKFGFLSFAPELILSAEGKVSSSENLFRNDVLLCQLSLPFKVSRNSLSLVLSEKIIDSDFSKFVHKGQFSWARPVFGSSKDLLIPSKIVLTFKGESFSSGYVHDFSLETGHEAINFFNLENELFGTFRFSLSDFDLGFDFLLIYSQFFRENRKLTYTCDFSSAEKDWKLKNTVSATFGPEGNTGKISIESQVQKTDGNDPVQKWKAQYNQTIDINENIALLIEASATVLSDEKKTSTLFDMSLGGRLKL